MKNQSKALPLRLLSVLVAALVALMPLPLFAAESGSDALWREDYYRASDTTGALSDAEQRSLDEGCIEFMQNYHADLSLLACSGADYEGGALRELAAGYYADCGFGYGPGADGFQMVWDTQTDEVIIEAYGAAKDMIPADYLTYVAGSVLEFREKYGAYGPMYATLRYLSNYLRGGADETAAMAGAEGAGEAESVHPGGGDFQNDAANRVAQADQKEADASPAPDSAQTADAMPAGDDAGTAGTSPAAIPDARAQKDGGDAQGAAAAASRMLPDGERPDEALRLGEAAAAAGKPAWYPKDPASFPFYHDQDAPRVVDVADIFSDEEEERMETRLARIRALLGRDIVVFTDVSTYGLSRSVYAADFYDFNGYGIGDDREGACLMVCMDPDNRGWWCCCTGPETMGLYTESIANQIDDMLYEYMAAGDYGAGVMDWIENFRRLYTTGSPYSEDWALRVQEAGFARFHDPDAPRVVDDAKILSAEEIAELTAQASALSGQYGMDVVIHTARNPGILVREDYGELYYKAMGYGFGDDYDGILLTIFKRPGYAADPYVYASGKALDRMSDVAHDRLVSRCDAVTTHREFYNAASAWISQVGYMMRTGRVPRSSASWAFTFALEALAGLIFGGISLGRARRGMATPKIKENANAYIVKDSVMVRKVHDKYIRSTVNRTYSPVKEDRSSGGSSGGSSYSGSYSGSSGSSHSGSGRSF